MTTAAEVVALLKAQGLTIATAESLTGGMLASELVSVPGASTVVAGGIVAYATRLKSELLGVDASLLERVGAIHPSVAEGMAAGVRERLTVDVGVATTGAAGPDPQDGQPPGTVWIAIATPAGTSSALLALAGDRAEIRRATVAAVLELVATTLAE